MRGDALAAVEDLDGGRGQARVDVFVDERVGDGVVMAVELDVIVDVDAGTDLPLAVDEGLRRQRAERGLIQPFEKVAAAGAVEPHRPRVEIREELGDPGVECGEGEEVLVPEGSVTSGFKMVFRSWAPGTDPASLPLSEMPKSIVVSRKALPPPNGSNGKNGPH